MVETQTVIPTDLQAARQVAENILGQAQARGYADDVCFAIRLAIEEALSNAVKHGNRFDPCKKITVKASVGGETMSVCIADEGAGFDPAFVPDPTAEENIEKPSGRGIMLMRAYMDQVSFNDRGNEVRMLKRKAQTP